MFFRGFWTLRRRCCTGPLLLLGIAVGLCYHTLTMDRTETEFKSDQQVQRNKSVMFDPNLLLGNPERLVSLLETSQADGLVSLLYYYFMLAICVDKPIILDVSM